MGYDNDRRGNRGGGSNRGGSRDGGFNRGGGFDRRPRETHKAVCAECNKECEVPFKPTQGKPVYCRECFQKHKPRFWELNYFVSFSFIFKKWLTCQKYLQTQRECYWQ